MIVSLRRTSLEWSANERSANWSDPQTRVRHRTALIPAESAIDVTYQIQLVRDSEIGAQLDMIYRVTYQDVSRVPSGHAQEATWPYLRMEFMHHLSCLGIEVADSLPVVSPIPGLTELPVLLVQEIPAVERSTHEMTLPVSLRTELRIVEAMTGIRRGGPQWLQSALHLYLALMLAADRRRKFSARERAALASLLEKEAACSLTEVHALPAVVRHRLRDQARVLMIAAIHAVTEHRADVDTGVIKDEFESNIEKLFDTETDGMNMRTATNDREPSETEAAVFESLAAPLLKGIGAWAFTSTDGLISPHSNGYTVFAHVAGFNLPTIRRSDNVGHARHMIGIHAALQVSSTDGGTTVLLHSEDVSDDFERWAAEYDVLSQNEAEQERLRHVEFLTSQPSPIPRTTFADLGAWAEGYADIKALNDDLLDLELTSDDLLEAA